MPAKRGSEFFVQGQDEEPQADTAQPEQKPAKKRPKAEQKEIPPELEILIKETEAWLDSYRQLFNTFAKDVSLSFKPALEGFKIDLEQGKVYLDMKWFKEQGYSQDQIIWACYHELMHFADLKSDPDGSLKNFDYIKSKGKSARTFHTFYNVFDDIFVNRGVASRAPAYTKETVGGKEVKRLYKEKLFPGTDYAELPRHLQFLYKLLRETMVPEEETIVSPEVAGILDSPVKVLGKNMTVRKFIDFFIKPTVSTFKVEDNLPRRRYELLRRHIEPLFEQLLKQDQADDKFKKQPPPQDGEPGGESQPGGEPGGEPGEESGGEGQFDEYYDDFDDKMPDQKPEDLKDWVKKEKERDQKAKEEKDKKKSEDAKAPEKKAAEAQGKADKEFVQRNNVPEKDLSDFRQIEKKVGPYLDELSHLWRSIVYGRSEDTRVVMDGFYRDGSDISIQQVVNEWPKIEQAKLDETRIYVKPVEKIKMRERPEQIRVRLVCDLSGSMDEAKREVLKQTAVLLMRSLEEFQTYLNMTRSLTKSKLNVDTEVRGFDDETYLIKPFARAQSGNPGEAERAEMIKSVGALSKGGGSTADNLAFDAVAKEIQSNQAYLADLKKEKVMDIMIEITDGGSDSVRDSTIALRRLEELTDNKIICRALQIGTVGGGDKQKFEQLWGNKGEAIGDKIENLPKAVAVILAKFLGNIKL